MEIKVQVTEEEIEQRKKEWIDAPAGGARFQKQPFRGLPPACRREECRHNARQFSDPSCFPVKMTRCRRRLLLREIDSTVLPVLHGGYR